jgi:hypothetical protein
MGEAVLHWEDGNGLQALVTLGRFLETEGWPPQQLEDAPIYQMSFSGEARYKSSLDFEGVALTLALIRNTLSPAVQVMVCYLPGPVSVIGGRSPAEALAQVDADCNCG